MGVPLASKWEKKSWFSGLVEVHFQPDKLSGVPAEVGMREHGPHQAAARSPWRPAFNKNRLLVLRRLGQRLFVVVLDERKFRHQRRGKSGKDQQRQQ